MNKNKLAKNPNTPPELLEVLATDEDWEVRYWVATNPNTPPEALKVLATDKYGNVRYCVAKNPNSTELMRRLVLMKNYEHQNPPKTKAS
jgi:hypothetical protein